MLVRSQTAQLAEREGALVGLGADRSVLRISGDSAELARAILAFLDEPRSREQLLAHLELLSEQPLQHVEVVDELLRVLLAAGVLREQSAGGPPEPITRSPRPATRLVLGISGAIGAAHTPLLLEALLERHFDIQIVATKTALRMVSRVVLEALLHRRVHASLHGHDPAVPAPHIYLAQWAEAVLVCPATATTISRIARGDCSDIVSAVALSTRAPVLVAPSMNPAMHDAPAIQRNLTQLQQDGLWLIRAGSAIEVADDPSQRQASWGAAPAPRAVVQLLEAVMATPIVHSG